jgi:hypothetical protein
VDSVITKTGTVPLIGSACYLYSVSFYIIASYIILVYNKNHIITSALLGVKAKEIKQL